MKNKLTIFLKNNLEFLLSVLISFVITFFIIFNNKDFVTTFIFSGINNILIGVFGGLIGLLLMAYSIAFGLSPTLNKGLLKSQVFLRINFLFLSSIIFTIILLVSSISLIFLEEKLIIYLVYFNLFIFILTIELIFIISAILFLLFKISRKELSKKSSSQ